MVCPQHRCFKPWLYSKLSRTFRGRSIDFGIDGPKHNFWFNSIFNSGKSRRIILSIKIAVSCPISSEDRIFKIKDKRIGVCHNSDIVWNMWTWNSFPCHCMDSIKWNYGFRNWPITGSNFINSISTTILSRQFKLPYYCIYDRNNRCCTKLHT